MYRDMELDGLTYKFRCHKDNPKRPRDWDVRLEFISFWDFPFEAHITVDNFYLYTFFIGRYAKGFFISIPSLYASAGIGWMDDTAYIRAELEKAKIPVTLVISFTEALRIINNVLSDERRRGIKKALMPNTQKKSYQLYPI